MRAAPIAPAEECVEFGVSIHGMLAGFRCGNDDTLLRACLRAGIPLPYECNVGACGSCRVEVTSGETENLWPEAPGLTDRDRRRGKILACQARPLSDVSIKVHLEHSVMPAFRPRRMDAVLRAQRDITSDIREFSFETDDSAEFHPGQYCLLHLPGVGAPRAYSMSNISNDQGRWEFQIRKVPGGEGTSAMFSADFTDDSRIVLDGPYGLAHLRKNIDRDIICIAGGSGLAPMVSIARGVVREPQLAGRKLHFFYGARTPLDICGEDMLRALPGFSSQIHYEAAVSTPATDRAWQGWTGLVHSLVGERMGHAIKDSEIYMAGPPPMIVAALDMLTTEYGADPHQIHFDRFF
jgi:toluene monooxygenase electron transfer component